MRKDRGEGAKNEQGCYPAHSYNTMEDVVV